MIKGTYNGKELDFFSFGPESQEYIESIAALQQDSKDAGQESEALILAFYKGERDQISILLKDIVFIKE